MPGNLIEKEEIASLPAGRQGSTRNDNFLNRDFGERTPTRILERLPKSGLLKTLNVGYIRAAKGMPNPLGDLGEYLNRRKGLLAREISKRMAAGGR